MSNKEEMEKERLSLLRRYARELAAESKRKQLEADIRFLTENGLDLNPGHIEQLKDLAHKRKLPYFLAARELRKQMMHDDLDFTFPFTPITRLKRIVTMVTEISLSKSWAETFSLYLENGNPEHLLDVMEYISWKAFDAKQSLFFYCKNLNEFPKIEDFINESR